MKHKQAEYRKREKKREKDKKKSVQNIDRKQSNQIV